jgi:hypothetical protein
MDRDLPPADTEPDLGGAQRAAPPAEGQTERPFSWSPIPVPDSGAGSALKGALERSQDPDARQGELPADSGETGQALMESPLQEYSASFRRETIQTEGGTKLRAESSSVAAKESPAIQAMFSDFPSVVGGQSGFDPAIERLRRRYLELLDERYRDN